MADFQSSQTAEQIETVLVGAITPTRGRSLTEAEKQVARDYIGATAFGDGIKVLAHFDTYDELVSVITKPAAGDSYSVGEQLPYRRYAYDFYHNEWRDYGPIRSEDISARLATNLVVFADEWIEDNTVFENYTFRASLPLGEITGNDFASVVFAPADAAGGNFCPVAFAFDGYIEIWANSRPDKETIVKSVTFIAIGTDGGERNNTAGITNATGALPADGIGTDLLANEAVTRDKLAADVKNLAFTDIAIPDYDWQEDGTFSLYPYRAKVELPNAGIDSSYFPDVVFDENNAALAPVADSTEGGVYVFAAAYPEEIIKIKSLICTPTKAIIPVNRVFGIIPVTYAAGKTVTCTDGTRTLRAKTTSGSWQFAVPYAGVWTVSDGESSQNVSVTAQGQTEIVNFDTTSIIYIVQNGIVDVDVSSPNYVTKTQNSNSVRFSISGAKNAMLVFGAGYDMTRKTKLSVVLNGGISFFLKGYTPLLCVGKNVPAYPNSDSVDSMTNVDKYVQLSSATGAIAGGAYELDVSELDGLYYVAVGFSQPTGANNGYIEIVDLTLE